MKETSDIIFEYGEDTYSTKDLKMSDLHLIATNRYRNASDDIKKEQAQFLINLYASARLAALIRLPDIKVLHFPDLLKEEMETLGFRNIRFEK